MSELAYKQKRFNYAALGIIAVANEICQDYATQGYDLTLRQLYYQFVARDVFPDDRYFYWTGSKWVRDQDHLNPESTKNNPPNYKWLGSIINDARLAGRLDWDYIVDRTRNIEIPSSWDSPASIIRAAAESYYVDRWVGQPYRVEVWVEKDALGGVIERACDDDRVPWFSCRGYTSQSSIWGAAQRFNGYIQQGQIPVVLHLGDHDPSGIDMTRDIRERLELFMDGDHLRNQWPEDESEGLIDLDDIREHMAEMIDHLSWDEHGHGNPEVISDELPVIVKRIALNMDQVNEYDPPPNYAKVTDSRSKDYIRRYGSDSWELDALEPRVLTRLIQDEVWEYIDTSIWDQNIEREDKGRETLTRVMNNLNSGEEE